MGWKEEKVQNPHPPVGETTDQNRISNTTVLGAARSQRGVTGRLCLCIPEPKHICAPVPTPGHASELCTVSRRSLVCGEEPSPSEACNHEIMALAWGLLYAYLPDHVTSSESNDPTWLREASRARWPSKLTRLCPQVIRQE